MHKALLIAILVTVFQLVSATSAQALCSMPTYCGAPAGQCGSTCYYPDTGLQLCAIGTNIPPQCVTEDCNVFGENCRTRCTPAACQVVQWTTCCSPATPPVGSGSGSGSGSCTSGDPFTGAADCGSVGRDPGSGSCGAGCLCCVPKTTYVPNCPYDEGSTGYPSCRYSEGLGCNANCRPPIAAPGSNCSGCADGLVGGGCSCPFCSIDATPNTVTIDVGESINVPLNTSGGNFSPSLSLSSSPMSIANYTYNSGTGSLTITGANPGSTNITITGSWTGYSPRNLCSDVIYVTVNPTVCIPGSMCGQEDPFNPGVYCPNTDGGTPPSVTITSPTDGSSFTPTGNQFTVTWTANSTIADTFYVELLPQGITCATAGTVPGAFCGTQSGTSITVSPIPAGHTTWTARVTALNTSCGVTLNSGIATSTFNLVGTIAGRFYLMPNTTPSNPPAGTNCSYGPSSGAAPSDPGSGAAVIITDVHSNSNTATIAGTGYTASVPYWFPGGNNVLQFTPGTTPAGTTFYKTICPTSNQYSGVSSPLTTSSGNQDYRDFYFAEVLLSKAWFQTAGGSIYAGLANAGDISIRSFIPTTTCTGGSCVPYVITQKPSGVADTAGVAITGGGNIDTNSAAGTSRAELTQRTSQIAAIGTSLSRREDFEYFARLYDINGSELDDFDGTGGRSSATVATKPTAPPRSGKAAYFTPGDMTISSGWSVSSGESYSIFVAGDLIISDPGAALELIQVAQGGFLAFIVQGDIRIANSVGHQPPYSATQANIEGMYIADGQIVIEADTASPRLDTHFIGEGTFVGWGGVVMNRDFGANPLTAEYNNTVPTESFIFRPDFVINVPPEMNNSTSQWQEVS